MVRFNDENLEPEDIDWEEEEKREIAMDMYIEMKIDRFKQEDFKSPAHKQES